MESVSQGKLKESWSRHQKTGSFVPLLVLLEQPLPEAKELVASLQIGSFPYSGLIGFAFSGAVGDYWAALAIGWLEQGARMDEEIAREVHAMVKSKWASQGTRHRAFGLVKRWEQEQSHKSHDA